MTLLQGQINHHEDGYQGAHERKKMVKLIAFFKRKPGMDIEDFQRYWRTGHADLAVKLAGMQRYVQCTTTLSAYRKGLEPVWDGVAETWFEDTQTIKSMAKTK